jgi:hypothetical protein
MTNTIRNMTKATSLACLLIVSTFATAQDGTIYPLQAPAEPNAILLGTGGVEGQKAPETWFKQWGDPMARNISTATLTPFLPKPGKGNGAAVIVAPGGGFRWLSLGNEGWEVAQALADKGIAAFVLKYRLHQTPESLDEFKESMNRTFAAATPPAASNNATPTPRPPMDLSNQLQDAEAAYAMIVKRAVEWGVDTARLGMIGFSAVLVSPCTPHLTRRPCNWISSARFMVAWALLRCQRMLRPCSMLSLQMIFFSVVSLELLILGTKQGGL